MSNKRQEGSIMQWTEMMNKILSNVLTALYQPFWFSVILTILATFFLFYIQEHGWTQSWKFWWKKFRSEREFRKIILLIFYTTMILFRTLLNRNMWANPVSNVIGTWTLHNEKGELTTEAIENLLLFIPFTFLLMSVLKDKMKLSETLWKVIWTSFKITLLFSFTIEFLQLFLRLGTFQLSDLFYNTVGGIFGGFVYWIYRKLENI